MAAFAGLVMVAKRGLVSIRSTTNFTGESGLKASSASPSTISTMPLDEAHLDRRERPPVEPADGAAALAAQEQVEGGIGKARLDRHEPGIVPSFGTEHRKLDRQRDRVEIVAE